VPPAGRRRGRLDSICSGGLSLKDGEVHHDDVLGGFVHVAVEGRLLVGVVFLLPVNDFEQARASCGGSRG
jgi:hypothetical protein